MFDKRVLLAGLAAVILCPGTQLVAAALEDPTRPADFVGTVDAEGSQQAQEPAWTVSSILIAKDRRIAVINGITVRQGDEVDGARVIRILPTAVRLRDSVGTFAVKLLPAQVKALRETK